MRVPVGVIKMARAALVESLPDTATVLRRMLADDGVGGQITTFPESHTLPCRLRLTGMNNEASQQNRAEAGRITAGVQYQVTLPANADILASDRLQIGGATYELLSPVRTSPDEICKRFLLKRL